MDALVTGAGGAIGSMVVSVLRERGDKVSALFLPGEDAAPAGAGLKILRGDVTVPETLDGIADGADCVIHLASRVSDYGHMELFREVASRGTTALLERSVGRVERFVYVSSIAAYGMGRDLEGFDEDAPLKRTGVPYCDTKIEAEEAVRAYTFGTGTSYTIVRPANVLGPGSVWVRDVVDAFLRGPVPLCDGGRHPTSFVEVENLAKGIVMAAASDAAKDRTYNFRDDYTATWREYLEELGEMVGRRPSVSIPSRVLWPLGLALERAYLPFFPARPPLSRMAVAVMGFNNDVDSTRAREELGWSTEVGYPEAMSRVEEWVGRNYPERSRRP